MRFDLCRASVLPGVKDVVVYLPVAPGEAEKLQAMLPAPQPTLVALHELDWNAVLSPWPAERVFRGGEDFAGCGEAFLQELTGRIIPAAETQAPVCRMLVGYSLGGLFAVWAALNTQAFQRVASVSGSMWFDGFAAYALQRPCLAERTYMSLGEREKHTRNPRMAAIEDCSRAIAEHLNCPLVMNPGGHFQDELPRMAKAIAALMA